MAAHNTSISLDQHFTDFLRREVEAGRYQTASEAVRAGLRLLEERETALAVLRQALTDGEQSGPATAFDMATFIASKKP